LVARESPTSAKIYNFKFQIFMMWFLIATLGYALLAVVFILDKLIVSKSISKPVVYTFYSTIFMFGALFALPIIDFGILSGVDWLWAVFSGVSFGFGLWTIYIALKKGETTHISPFNGAMVTIFTYLAASFFLSETLDNIKLVGIVILVFSSLLLSFEKSKKHSGFHSGFVWAIISGLFFAISHVSAKYLYDLYPFWTAFIWTRAFTGIVGLITLLFPAVWRSFKPKREESKTYARRHTMSIVIADKVLGVISVICLQYAIAISSVTLVNALVGMQYVLMFVLVYLLTKFLPKIFKEYFTKREFLVEVVAIVLVTLGLVLFVL